jgi:hypothetical protein
MNTNTLRPLALGALLALLAAGPAAGQTARYQQYVALGDSLTAGWQSGCLVERNQLNSYPAVLASILFDGTFQMPLVEEIALTNPPTTACLGAVFIPPATVTVGPISEMGPPLNLAYPAPYNDVAIPGAEVADLTTLTHGDVNGTDLQKLSALILRNVTGSPFDGTSEVTQAALLLAPAGSAGLATLWVGNNNTLGASTSGIVVDGVTLVSQADFQASYDAIIAGLPASSALVVANIPDVTAIPFSTTIPPVLVNPTTRQPVIINGQLVPLLGPGDAAYPCTPVPPDTGCALPSGTLVNLPASSLLAMGQGIPKYAGGLGTPLPHGSFDSTGPHAGVILYPDDIALLQSRTAEYNEVIATSSRNAVQVDANGILGEIAVVGYDIGGIHLSTDFLTGGIFSYDGVHPSTIGYTIIADKFIQAINDQTGSDFPRPNYSNVLFTPNVPPASVTGSVTGGPWNFTYEMWSNVLNSTVSPRLKRVQLPPIPAARIAPRNPVRRATRTVERESGR